MKKYSLYILCLIFIYMFSCRDKNAISNSKTNIDSPYFKPNFTYIHLIPDSLRTDDQNKFLEKLVTVISTYQKIEHDSLVFKLNKKDFIAMGFPVEYYDLIEKDIKNNNEYFKKNKIMLVDPMLNHSLIKQNN